ncbi:hypothetical protein HPB48_017890 [Haemaphysalis longicornis]|uniref:Carboxylesterase type B domain-containing protein n=1 Tax=Haemaphysalis longicornis TaxID=44386 RepID=A0A9J6GSH1_HAELO|nr:hypothetical protein HPB48_017890 [Haemaphysalis longicornis]
MNVSLSASSSQWVCFGNRRPHLRSAQRSVDRLCHVVPPAKRGLSNTTRLGGACTVARPEQLVVAAGRYMTIVGLAGRVLDASNQSTRGVLRRFLGIPYAVAPSGHLRFGRPNRLTDYLPNGSWYAYAHGPPCPQNGPLFESSDEDCLRVSIWAPYVCNASEPPKPVVVALAGEWLQSGDASRHEALWQELVLQGDLIVAAPNHRLGVLGFFAGDVPDAKGNDAIYDVLLALTWIKDNAAAFHGDANLMVALGHGSGGFMLATDLLQGSGGHFKRYILHGLSLRSNFPENNDVTGVSLLKAPLNCSGSSTEPVTKCLRGKKYKDIVASTAALEPLRFVPSRYQQPIDRVFNATDLRSVFRNLSGVEIICGYSAVEGSALFDEYVFPSLKADAAGGFDPPKVFSQIVHFFGYNFKTHFDLLPGSVKENLKKPELRGFREILTDVSTNCPMLKQAKEAGIRGATVYHYASLGPQDLFEPALTLEDIIQFAKTGSVHCFHPFPAVF